MGRLSGGAGLAADGQPCIAPVSDYAGCVLFLKTSEEMPSATEVYRILRCMGERDLLGQFGAVLLGRAKAWSFDHPAPPASATPTRQASGPRCCARWRSTRRRQWRSSTLTSGIPTRSWSSPTAAWSGSMAPPGESPSPTERGPRHGGSRHTRRRRRSMWVMCRSGIGWSVRRGCCRFRRRRPRRG